MRLTTEQHGAYLLLLMDYWTNGPPPDDDAVLAAITKVALKRWPPMRATMLRYFHIQDGVWRQDRADRELERWAEKKRAFAERAAAGGRAKAAKSRPQAVLEGVLDGCTSSASGEVRAHNGALTLSGQNDFIGPKEVRDAFVTAKGEAWTASYIDRCGWQDVPERALIPATRLAGGKIVGEARKVLGALGLIVLERAA